MGAVRRCDATVPPHSSLCSCQVCRAWCVVRLPWQVLRMQRVLMVLRLGLLVLVRLMWYPSRPLHEGALGPEIPIRALRPRHPAECVRRTLVDRSRADTSIRHPHAAVRRTSLDGDTRPRMVRVAHRSLTPG